MSNSTFAQPDDTRGFVFVCWGKDFIQEACASVRRIKGISQYPCTLITVPGETVPPGIFDQIIPLPLEGSYRAKISMRHSPYTRTVFLDSDTHVLKDFAELFDALKRFDILYQPTAGGYHYKVKNVPMSVVTEPSAGLVVWRRNAKTEQFFELWDKHYLLQQKENGADGAWDQRSMRAALYECEAHVFPIPKEWQVSGWETSVLLGDAKMVHGRDRHTKFAMANINNSNDLRLYFADVGFIFPLNGTSLWDYLRLAGALLKRAIRRMLRLILHRTGMWRLPTNGRRM